MESSYAEVLEHTQYALIATVHKLYDMIRRGEEWTYGEPELNDRGLPVIHNIAEKLGCIRQAPDVNYTFPEGEEDFLELQQRLQASALLEGGGDSGKTDPQDPEQTMDRTERASSSESDRSEQSSPCNSQHQQDFHETEPILQTKIKQEASNVNVFGQSRLPQIQIPRSDFSQVSSTQQRSPRSAFTPESYTPESPFTNYALGSDDFLAPAPVLDANAQYLNLRQQQKQRFSFSQALPYNLPTNQISDFSNCNEFMNGNYYNSVMGGDETIRPGMLEGAMDFDFGRLDAGELMFDYMGENTMMIAS